MSKDRKSKRQALFPAICLVTFLLLIISLLHWFGGGNTGLSHDKLYDQILADLLSSQPSAVSISPHGRYLLTKEEDGQNFSLSISDKASGKRITSSSSAHTQRSLTWRPDSRAIAFQESIGMERPLYLLDIETGIKSKLNIPVPRTALPPLRWDPEGRRFLYFNGDWKTGQLLIINCTTSSLPITIATGLSATCDFAWSPSGKQIVVADNSQTGHIAITDLETMQRREILVATNGFVRELSWSPDGQSILATARAFQGEFYRLVKVDVTSTRCSLEAATTGDISRPFWLPNGRKYLYHVNDAGLISARLGDTEGTISKPVGPTRGVVYVTGISADGEQAYARYASLSLPPQLCEISLNDGTVRFLYSPPESQENKCPEPEFIRFNSSDGTEIPAYHWRSIPKAGHQPTVLIMVHGGSHLQTFPVWDPSVQAMIRHGCDVVAINHRGSSGYGKQFEQKEGDPALDILAARSYALNILGIQPGRIFLLGHSTGASLVAAAVKHGDKFGGLMLISSALYSNQGSEWDSTNSYPVVAFHGEKDAVLSPKAAQQSIRQFCSSARPQRLTVKTHLLKGEEHSFYRMDSLAKVARETLKMMNLD